MRTRVLPAIACTALIFYGGLIRLGPLPHMGKVPSDKVGHALVFGALCGLLVSALRYLRPALSLGRSVLLAVALGVGARRRCSRCARCSSATVSAEL